MKYHSKRPSFGPRRDHSRKVDRRHKESVYHIAHDLRDRLHGVTHMISVLKRQQRWINAGIRRAKRGYDWSIVERAEDRADNPSTVNNTRVFRAHRQWDRFLAIYGRKKLEIEALQREAEEIKNKLKLV